MSGTLILAPHEDGLGAAAWTVRIVRELLRHGQGRFSRICVLVSSQAMEAYFRDKWGGRTVQVLRLPEVRHSLRFIKKRGGVDVALTMENMVREYAASQQEYRHALEKLGILADAALVVDLGVPQLMRVVHEENRRREVSDNRAIRALTVHDHSWSLSLKAMAAAEGLLTGPRAAVLRLLQDDEARTSRAILFPDPITPEVFSFHWRDVLGVPILRLPGVLGGPRWTERWAGDVSRSAVCSLLGIEDDLPVLFISGGGTPVWDDMATELLDDYIVCPPRYHVVVYNPPEVRRRGIRLTGQPTAAGMLEWARHPACPQLVFLGRVAGETHHPLFAAFDLVLTRAGGGTVNDAIAFRVPLMLIEEPAHWQVEQIRAACQTMGICRTATLEEFRLGGRRLVETPGGELIRMESERTMMEQIPNHGEVWLARRLLETAEASF